MSAASSQDLREWLENEVLRPPSRRARPARSSTTTTKTIYKQRNIIERIVCRFKDRPRTATRFDSNIKNLVGAIALAATIIWWL